MEEVVKKISGKSRNTEILTVSKGRRTSCERLWLPDLDDLRIESRLSLAGRPHPGDGAAKSDEEALDAPRSWKTLKRSC
jgi:hypothetical protein